MVDGVFGVCTARLRGLLDVGWMGVFVVEGVVIFFVGAVGVFVRVYGVEVGDGEGYADSRRGGGSGVSETKKRGSPGG